MSCRGSFLTLLLVLASASRGIALETVTVRPDPAAPGDILVIETAAHPSRATFALTPLRFFKWQGKYRALAGIDIETPPGKKELSLQWTQAPPVKHVVAIRERKLEKKSPPDVPAALPPDAKDRIWSETQRLDSLFRRVSPQMLWSDPFQKPVEAPVNASVDIATANGRPDHGMAGVRFRIDARIPVHASNAGRVVLAEDLYRTGKTVILDHGFGLYTLYAQLGRIDVQAKQRVVRGHVLGEVGNGSGASSLYWGARLLQARVDPLQLLALE